MRSVRAAVYRYHQNGTARHETATFHLAAGDVSDHQLQQGPFLNGVGKADWHHLADGLESRAHVRLLNESFGTIY